MSIVRTLAIYLLLLIGVSVYADGIPEDAVTGSTHTALVPLWSDRLGRRQLVGIQASARTGRLYVELRADRVWITGRAVTVLDGTLLVPTEDMNGNA